MEQNSIETRMRFECWVAKEKNNHPMQMGTFIIIKMPVTALHIDSGRDPRTQDIWRILQVRGEQEETF